jgi:hypothetical protein
VQFECAYDPERHILTFAGGDHQLDSTNVVVIDHIDHVGGPPQIVRRLTVSLPSYVGGSNVGATLRQIPELQEFLR